MPRYHITAEAVFGYRLYLCNYIGRDNDHLVFGPFDTVDEIKKFYHEEQVAPYEEEGPDLSRSGESKLYTKYFRKGGPMEWCAPLTDEAQWSHPDEKGSGVAECLLDIFDIVKKVSYQCEICLK